MKYLLDTDWVIDYLHSVQKVVQKVDELAPTGLGVSILAVAELFEGVYYSTDPVGNERALKTFLTGVSVLGIDEETCQVFARERGRLRRLRRQIGDFDLLIASTCLRHDLILLTHNRKHFERVQDLQMLA